MLWTTASPDWERRIVAGESLIPVGALFPAEADAAMEVFDALRVVDAAGSPTFGELNRPWMRDFARAIFGAYDPATGRRLIREFFLLVAKKNGKSTLAAGVMLTALVLNWRQSAEFYIVAPTKEVADNSFFAARDMVKADPELALRLRLKPAERTIVHKDTGAILKVIAADAETVSGKKGVGVLVDELWLFGKRANAENMLSEATGGLVSRPEGFVIYLSTQSDEPPAGAFAAKLDYFRKIRDGELAVPHALPVLFEFPREMIKAEAFLDPANFYITNPNLGLIVDEQWLRDKLAEKTEEGARARSVFLAKHLNVELGANLRGDWAGAEYWSQCADPTLDLTSLIKRSECIVVGLDGGGLDDLLGLAVLGRESDTKRWLLWVRAYCRVTVFRRRKKIAAELLEFVKRNDLWVYDQDGRMAPDEILEAMKSSEAPPPPPAPREEGAPVEIAPDIAALIDLVDEVQASGKLAWVGIDTAGIGLIVEGLKTINIWQREDGRDEPSVPLDGVTQGYKLMGPIKTAERMLFDRTLVHAGQKLMAWSVGNARTEAKGNAVMITKAQAGVAKIDALMAGFVAVALMSTNPEPAGSVYTAERGLRSFG